MPEEIFYFIGSFIIGVIILMISYKFILTIIKQSSNDNILRVYEKIYNEIETACTFGSGYSIGINYYMPTSVKSIYATNDVQDFAHVADFVDSAIYSEGNHFCIFFKDEDKPRCKETKCTSMIQFMGSRDFYNDFQIFVNKILGKAPIKKYYIYIENIDGKVYVTRNNYIYPERNINPFLTVPNVFSGGNNFVILVMQLDEQIDNFRQKAEDIGLYWAAMTPLSSCRDKVKVIALESVCDVPDQNLVCIDPSKADETFQKMVECAQSSGFSGVYTRLVGLKKGDYICSIATPSGVLFALGYTGGYGYPVVSAERSYIETSLHELGHTYGLCDEGYGSACDTNCPSGYSNSDSCNNPTGECCPNRPEQNSLYCSANLCNDCNDPRQLRQCSFAFNFAPSSYQHLENELGHYCR